MDSEDDANCGLWFSSFYYFALFVLQSIVSKLVSCITALCQVSADVEELQPNGSHKPHMLLVGLLERLTVNANHTLHDSIKVSFLSTDCEPSSDSVGLSTQNFLDHVRPLVGSCDCSCTLANIWRVVMRLHFGY